MPGLHARVVAGGVAVEGELLDLPQVEPETTVFWRFFRSLRGERRADARLVEVSLDTAALMASEMAAADAVLLTTRLNHVRRINRLILDIAHALPLSGRLVVSADTLEARKAQLRRRYPRRLARFFILMDLLFRRVPSKLPLLKHIYFTLTRGRGRLVSRAEVLGRLTSCGFTIERETKIGGVLYVEGRKSSDGASPRNPSYGPIFRMRRVGKGGRPIHVFKLRTMYPYAEFVQAYAYEVRRLAPGGKIRNDFRVTDWGRHARRLWLDELPMLINWARRDLKLVGVRPLSEHFLTLYPEVLRERRTAYRPGLVPPFYADLPTTFDEILASETNYLDAYDRAPFLTDVRYFCGAAANIIFRRARSA